MKKYNQEIAVGLFVCIGLLCIAYMSVRLGNITLFDDESYVLHASFTKITGLKINAPVSMYGVEVGHVSAITLDLEGKQTNTVPVAVVEMKIGKQYVIDNEATASIKTSGLIGDKFVDISLGMGEEPLLDGATIFATVPAVDLEDLIGKFASGEL